jgi:hypothetical protein
VLKLGGWVGEIYSCGGDKIGLLEDVSRERKFSYSEEREEKFI